MSVDLNAELNAFRAMIVTLKDDIIRQRDAVSASSINTTSALDYYQNPYFIESKKLSELQKTRQ